MITDFIVSLDGVRGFERPTWNKDPVSHFLNTYYAERKLRGQDRLLLRAHMGVRGGDIQGTVDLTILTMRHAANADFNKEGFLCLFGSSHGATIALALAAELHEKIKIIYLCLADLPLFNGGRNPPIEGVCRCDCGQPRHYEVVRDVKIGPKIFPKAIKMNNIFVEGDRPSTLVTKDIRAKTKENVYQHNGNHIKPYLIRHGWHWSSSMDHEEVHGKIRNSDWINIEKDVSGNPNLDSLEHMDPQHHKNLDDWAKFRFDERLQETMGKAWV